VKKPLPASMLLGGALLCALVSGCGGGAGSTAPPPPPPPPPPTALTITTASPLPRAIQGQPYSVGLKASGGTSPYSWSTQLLGIAGMTLAADGTLSGTPTQALTFIPVITVTDSNGHTASKSIELDVYAPLAFTTAASLPDLNIALPVGLYISASGGSQPYAFSLAQGSTMPPGLTFANGNAVGLIQGTPTAPGKYSFTVQVTDSFTPPFQTSQTFTMNVLNNLVLPNTNLPDAVQNISYHEQIMPAGGTPPYHFVLGQFSSMPAGLTMDASTGIVSGTPTTSLQNTDVLLVTITDSASPPASINPFVSISVQPPLSIQTTTLPDSARGLNYGGQISIAGGRAPYKLQVLSGALPDGLTLGPSAYSPTFNVTGVSATDGLFKFSVQVTDAYETPNTAKQNFQIRISDQMTLSGPTQVNILYNQSYSAAFPATGGFPPYTWRMDSVPPGFTFDTTTGTLSGTPTSTGNASPNVFVQDSSNPPLTASYFSFSFFVTPKLVILTTSLPTVSTASTVLLQPLTSGGAAPLTWTVTSGTMPPGTSLGTLWSGDTFITGSPTAAGTYAFTLSISDGNTGSLHQTTSQQLVWTVKTPGTMARNDTTATATAISNIALLASISPFRDAGTAGPDVDYYSASAAPGSIVQVYAAPNNDFVQPPEPNSMQPVLEIVDSHDVRYQACASAQPLPGQLHNLPCVNNLPGTSYLQGNYYSFQVPGTGTAPVTFYIRVSDARGDARPDFIYTLGVYGVN
jgi:putative Ig domain-containing protein